VYLAGVAMIVFGVTLEDKAAAESLLILLGTGLIVVGVLLPRLSGTLEISATGVKIPIESVLERLEVTRREAQVHAPDRVQEAVGRAYEILAPLLAAGEDLRFAVAPPAPKGSSGSGTDGKITCKRCGHANEEWETFCGSCGEFLRWAGEKVSGATPSARKPGGVPRGDGVPEEPSTTTPDAPVPSSAGQPPPPGPPRPTAPSKEEAVDILADSPAAFAERILRELEADPKSQD
jgi:hypothetical protein